MLTLNVCTDISDLSAEKFVPSRTKKTYYWQKLCTKLGLGLSDVAIPDS